MLGERISVIAKASVRIENDGSHYAMHIQPALDKVLETPEPDCENLLEIACLSTEEGDRKRGVAEPLDPIVEEPSSTRSSNEILPAHPYI